MKKIIALGGSNSKQSINKQLAQYTASQVEGAEVILIDLNDYTLPLYGIDEEQANGIPSDAQKLNELFLSADGFVVSLAEHNGSYTVAFKNAYDWLSRMNAKVWNQKPVFIMATSPGGRGGIDVLNAAKSRFPHMGANIVADFSLPSFQDNFTPNGITNEELNNDLNDKIALFSKAI